MHRRFYAQLAAIAALPLLAGCQMTRHSNMMVFGTNTVVGLRVGANATSVPSIDFGYTRQEAVLMPLVANVADSGAQGGNGAAGKDASHLVPCDMKTSPTLTVHTDPAVTSVALPTRYAVHPCLFVAVNDKEGAQDSYSVLASFGANFGANAKAGETSAQGGLAQYFATGMAAQLLALNGGAAVVATGPAAARASDNQPVALNGLTPTETDRGAARVEVSAYLPLRSTLAARVRTTPAEDLGTRFKDFQGALGGPTMNIMGGACNSPTSCADRVDGNYFFDNYDADAKKFQDAITAWPSTN